MDPSNPGIWSHNQGIDLLSSQADPYDTRPSLADITVADILERYKHDTDLLKHILLAKTEEDKVRPSF